MDNVTFIKIAGNGEYTSMLKSTYDEMIARNEASTL